jgi:hypothetical protein
MKNEKSQNLSQTPALSQKQSKDTKKPASKTKRLVYISIDLDSGAVLIETSPSVRKIEPCPVGFYVSFLSMSKAKQLKKRFEKKPYLIQNFINS